MFSLLKNPPKYPIPDLKKKGGMDVRICQNPRKIFPKSSQNMFHTRKDPGTCEIGKSISMIYPISKRMKPKPKGKTVSQETMIPKGTRKHTLR